MPRSTQSMEGKILQWFRTAPITSVWLVLELAKEAVKERQTKKAEVPAVGAAPVRASRMRRGKPNGGEQAQVEEFK